MIWQKLRKVGNSYIVTIPKEEIERQHLQEGQLLAVEVRPAEVRPVASPELREAFEESWKRNEAAYRYLAEN
jgi:antitoxin component of MazEF toxin-antitoxin module